MAKRLIIRADDVGYTKTFDRGVFKAIDEGIVTCADVMLDSLDSASALVELKKRPWISVGWHSGHLWGWPVAPASKVKSMVNEAGKFKWGHNTKLQDKATYQDALVEFEAQIQKCIKYYGKAPVSTSFRNNNELDKAKQDICDKYGIIYGAIQNSHFGFKEEYKKFNYFETPVAVHVSTDDYKRGDPQFDYKDYKEGYDPVRRLKTLKIEDGTTIKVALHPGYLDAYVMSESSCTLHRVKDVIALTSQEIKDWIIENQIELVNENDVFNGTSTYQDHLKEINSPLWVGNFK